MSHTHNQHAKALANYLPGGRLFSNKVKEGSNVYNVLLGLAYEMKTASDYVEDYRTDILPDQTVHFIDEWESALQIPDDCFPGTGDLDTRRSHILVKLAALGVQTAQDFVDLAALLGVTVEIFSEIDTKQIFPVTFPMIFSEPITLPDDRFTIVVKFIGVVTNSFPQTFPIQFSTPEAGVVECLFRKLKPANCDIIFISVP